MDTPSAMVRALRAARGELPELLERFDALARAGAAAPSFEEYSARLGGPLGDPLQPWRETIYFDVASTPALVAVANERFEILAQALGFALPPRFVEALRGGRAGADPCVLQIVLGIDAAADRPRLKYYLIYRADSRDSVEALRVAVGAPTMPQSLRPGSVYILGIDFTREGLSDFKVYVRLEPRRVPAAIRNLGRFEELWRGSRYLVFQHCVVSGGRQVYFHASSSGLLRRWLEPLASRDTIARAFTDQLAAMNASLADAGHAILQPWIVSFPYRSATLLDKPSNVYLHFTSDEALKARRGRAHSRVDCR